MILIQAAILQIMIKRNLISVFSNRQKSVAVANMNTEMIIEIIDLFSRANNILIEILNVEIKNISFNHSQNLK